MQGIARLSLEILVFLGHITRTFDLGKADSYNTFFLIKVLGWSKRPDLQDKDLMLRVYRFYFSNLLRNLLGSSFKTCIIFVVLVSLKISWKTVNKQCLGYYTMTCKLTITALTQREVAKVTVETVGQWLVKNLQTNQL